MAGKKILTQFALPVGSTSGDFGNGTAGQVLTSGGANASMYWGTAGGSSGVGKKTYEFRWMDNTPPSGVSFHQTNAANDTVRLTHTFGTMTIVNMIDENGLFGGGNNVDLIMGDDVLVTQGNNTLDITLTGIDANEVPAYSDNKNFKVIIIG